MRAAAPCVCVRRHVNLQRLCAVMRPLNNSMSACPRGRKAWSILSRPLPLSGRPILLTRPAFCVPMASHFTSSVTDCQSIRFSSSLPGAAPTLAAPLFRFGRLPCAVIITKSRRQIRRRPQLSLSIPAAAGNPTHCRASSAKVGRTKLALWISEL